MSKPLIEDPTFYRAHVALQKLWSKAVGSPGYVKAEWTELDNAIVDVAMKEKR